MSMRHKKKLLALLMSSAVIAACGSEELAEDANQSKLPTTQQTEQNKIEDKPVADESTPAKESTSEEVDTKQGNQAQESETKPAETKKAPEAPKPTEQKGETPPMKQQGSLTVEQVEKQRAEREKTAVANQQAVSDKDSVIAKEAKEVASLKIVKGVSQENVVSFLIDDVKGEAPFYITVNDNNYFFRQSQANAKRFVTEVPSDVTEDIIKASSIKALAK